MRFLLVALMLFSTTFLLAQNIDVKGKIVDTNRISKYWRVHL